PYPTLFRSSLFRNEISDENTIHACLFRFLRQLLFAKFQKRIEIAEQNNWNIDTLLYSRSACQCVSQCHAIPQRAFGCTLNYFTVRNWITEGNAQFDNVCPSRSKLDEQELSGRNIRVTGSDEWNKAAASFALKRSERFPNSAHRLCKSATSLT